MGRFTFLLCVLLAYPSAGFAQNFALSLDANSASGDQSVLSANTSANQSVSIQVFGTGLTDAKAVNLRFEFDANQVLSLASHREYPNRSAPRFAHASRAVGMGW